MNALDRALQVLAAASTALEHTDRPSLKDVEDAKEAAKSAHEILDAAHKLLKRNIYSVAYAPPEPGTALPFDAPSGPSVPLTEPLPDDDPSGLRPPYMPQGSFGELGYTPPDENADAQEAEIVDTENDEELFESLLKELKDWGMDDVDDSVKAGMLKEWNKHKKLWNASFKADPAGTIAGLRVRLEADEVDWTPLVIRRTETEEAS